MGQPPHGIFSSFLGQTHPSKNRGMGTALSVRAQHVSRTHRSVDHPLPHPRDPLTPFLDAQSGGAPWVSATASRRRLRSWRDWKKPTYRAVLGDLGSISGDHRQ
uniref:Uncharacterized protein n=1 Tax=Arundo donax TaxID=35708 RepID=A0A0A9BIF4_ARUDO